LREREKRVTRKREGTRDSEVFAILINPQNIETPLPACVGVHVGVANIRYVRERERKVAGQREGNREKGGFSICVLHTYTLMHTRTLFLYLEYIRTPSYPLPVCMRACARGGHQYFGGLQILMTPFSLSNPLFLSRSLFLPQVFVCTRIYYT